MQILGGVMVILVVAIFLMLGSQMGWFEGMLTIPTDHNGVPEGCNLPSAPRL